MSAIAFVAVMIAMVVMTSSCGEKRFKVNGEIKDGADKSIVLERSDYHGLWMAVDSTRIKPSGSFSLSAPAPVAPDVYRLALDGRYIYFPVDSVETVTLTADAADFGGKYTLAGSDNAVRMAEFDQSLHNLDMDSAEKVTAFKRDVYNKYIMNGRGSIMSYYVLTKIVNGKMLYDPRSAEDVPYYAAVATAFDQYRPEDPHTAMLKEITMQAMKNKNANSERKNVIEASELALIDITLNDEKGNPQTLSKIAGNGKPTVVAFSMMNLPESPDFNRELLAIYAGGNVNIYHVSLDDDMGAWRDAAVNLPWITVIEPNVSGSQALVNYNVRNIPSFYIYDRKGELVEKAESFSELKKKLSAI